MGKARPMGKRQQSKGRGKGEGERTWGGKGSRTRVLITPRM